MFNDVSEIIEKDYSELLTTMKDMMRKSISNASELSNPICEDIKTFNSISKKGLITSSIFKTMSENAFVDAFMDVL